MQHTPRLVRVLIGILLLGLLLLPLVLFFVRKPQVATLLPLLVRPKSATTNRYSVQTDTAGYSLALVDTSYLDYVAADLNIFMPNVIADPRVYSGNLGAMQKRTTVTSIKFVLVDKITTKPISTIINFDAKTGSIQIVARGDYIVEGDTLVIRNAVDFASIGSSEFVNKFAWEDAFLRASVTTLYYALGKSDQISDRQAFGKIKQDIDKNVYTGIFSWPFRITEKKL